MIDGIRSGQFVVIATDRSDDSAFWGELFSAAAMSSGAVGVLTDGNLRDTEKIAALGFAAFARSRRPIDFRARMRIVDVDEPVVIGDVRIEPGDLVAADDDGIVVVPRMHEHRVLDLARQRASSESTVLSELLAGESLRAVWDRHHVL
jgi:regulator of RNase E activity RraA